MSENIGALPLRRRFWARTRSVEEAQEAINRACGPVALEIEPDAGPIEWRSERFTLGPIEIATHWLSAPAVLRPEQGDDHDLFLMIGLGERGLRSAILRIERCALEQHLHFLTGVRPEEPLVFAPTLDASSGAGAEIRRLLLFILDALDQKSCVLRSPLVLANLSDALMTALLVGQPHNHAALFGARSPRPPAPCLRRV